MQRVFAIDVLLCPSCGGRMKAIAEITDRRVAPEDARARRVSGRGTRAVAGARAGELGLEAARFERDRNDPKTTERVSAQSQQCTSLGARGTPSFFINGRILSGAQPIEAFRALIDEEAKEAAALLRKGVKPKKLYDAIIEGGKTAP